MRKDSRPDSPELEGLLWVSWGEAADVLAIVTECDGAEAAMWGPGAIEQWHSEDERIAVSDLVGGAVSYVGMIEDYLCQ